MTLKDLNRKGLFTTKITESNLLVLRERVNKVEAQWEVLERAPFVVTSGLRSAAQQEGLIKAGKSTATKSRHLIGAAVDIADEGNLIKDWLRANPRILEEAGLWCEHWEATEGWCHMQIIPPLSGNRWFRP